MDAPIPSHLERLRSVPLFSKLSDADLRLLGRGAESVPLAAGAELFAEGDPPDHMYLISSGQVEILKQSGPRRVLLAVLSADDVIGEMALLEDSARTASARARTDVELITFSRSALEELLQVSPDAVKAVFEVLLERWKSTQAQLAHSERMAQLGTLTAGLAHELNNPASAVERAAGRLGEVLARTVRSQDQAANFPAAVRQRLAGLSFATTPPAVGPLERADLEDRVDDRLRKAGVAESWRLAPTLVEAGLADEVADLVAEAGDHAAALMALIVDRYETAALVDQIQTGAGRLSDLVGAIGSYSYLDRGPIQSVDLPRSLDETLLLLRGRLAGVSVERRYHPNLAPITAHGAELNQVWTNLIVNAIDAIEETDRTDGTIAVRAFPEGGATVVEVEDNGAGIEPGSLARVFDPFYTTKPPGSGTGLGLHISYRIVVEEHGGDLTVTSTPGRTIFRVELPPPS